MSDLSHPDNEPLQPAVATAPRLPIVAFVFADYVGEPADARMIARELARQLSAEAQRIVERDFPREKLRIVVTLQ